MILYLCYFSSLTMFFYVTNHLKILTLTFIGNRQVCIEYRIYFIIIINENNIIYLTVLIHYQLGIYIYKIIFLCCILKQLNAINYIKIHIQACIKTPIYFYNFYSILHNMNLGRPLPTYAFHSSFIECCHPERDNSLPPARQKILNNT